MASMVTMLSPAGEWGRELFAPLPFEFDEDDEAEDSRVSSSSSSSSSSASFRDGSFRTEEIDIPQQTPSLVELDHLLVLEDCELRGWQFHALVQCSALDRRLTLNPSPADEELLENFMQQTEAASGLLAQAAPEGEGVFALDW